jgi:D-alanine-D-alanine ligase
VYPRRVGRIRVGILFGGRSAEHEVSILSARNVLAALDRERFEPVLIGIGRDGRWLLQDERRLLESAGDPRLVNLAHGDPVAMVPVPDRIAAGHPSAGPLEVVFPVLHGPMGEDGTIQGLLELADLPYVGAGVLGSAVGMDKDVGKRLLRAAGIPVAAYRVVRKAEFERDADAACRRAEEVGFPLFAKPANLGSSVGVTRVGERAGLRAALAHAFEYDSKALVEEMIRGREIECSVLGDELDARASIPGEIVVRHPDGFYSYQAKYIDESGAGLEIPARLAPHEVAAVQRMAIEAFHALEGHGMARVDFFLRDDGALLVNEVNTIPGFTAISMYPKLWEASGLSARELVTRLIELALARHAARRALRTAAAELSDQPSG